MVKRRRHAKKKMMNEEESCDMNHGCYCGMFFTKLAAMAFILFLVTVWPKFGSALLSVHWGWYLGAMIVFGGIGMSRYCCCKGK